MNGTQIINSLITYSTPELDEAKFKMAQVLDKMIAHLPTLKAEGINEDDISAMADTMIRQQAKRIFATNYMVERNGQMAILGIGREQINSMIEMFEKKI
jgi:hypothetical protein